MERTTPVGHIRPVAPQARIGRWTRSTAALFGPAPDAEPYGGAPGAPPESPVVRRAHSRGLRSRTGCGAGGDSPGGYGSGPGPEPATALTHPPVLRGTRAGPQSRRHDAVDLDVVGPGDLDPWRGRASRRQARSSRRGWSTVATVRE